MLTGSGDETLAVEVMKHGAQDYLRKAHVTIDTLTHAIANAIENVTLRRRLDAQQRALAESAARLRTTLESLTDGFHILDRQWRFTYVNQRAKELWGRPHEDFVGKNVWEEFPDSQHDVFGTCVRKAMLEQETASCEGYYAPMRAWVALRAYPSADGVAVYFQDITAHKRADETLRRQAEIIDHVHDSVVATDLTGIVTYWNKGAERLFGYTAGEMVGHPIASVYPNEDHDFLQEHIIAPLCAQGQHALEVRMRRKSGEFFYAHLSLSLLRDVSGTPTGMIGYAIDITARKVAVVGVVGTAHDITVRKQAEETLRQSEERLRLFVTQAPVAIAMCDRHMHYLAVSRRWQADYGLGTQELIGRSHYELFPDLPPAWRAAHARALAGAVERNEEDCFVRRDGTVQWLRWEVQPWRYASGEVGGLIIFSEDITVRKEVERALTESEQRWRTVAEALPALVWMARPDGFLDYYNQRWHGFTGLTAAQLAGWGWQKAWHPEDLPGGRARWQETLHTGEPYEYQARLRRAVDNTYRWQLIRAVPMRDAAGQVQRWFGTTIDIEDQKRAELALQASEERLRLALHAGRLGTWELDTMTGSNWFSPETEALWGFAPGTFPGTWEAFAATIHPDDHQRVHDLYQQIATGQAAAQQEYRLAYRIIRPDGTVRWIEVFGQYFSPTPDGPVVGSRGVAMDITERKVAETERERLLTELQRINGEFQQFSYIVSHDLNEPLRTMRNYIQLVARQLQGKLDDDAQECMAFVTDAAQWMQQMITDLLAYTRAGQTPAFHPVDCKAVLAQALQSLHTRIVERGAIITHDPLPTVSGDATRIGQVLQNLIGNALKFCEATPPRIHLSALKEHHHWRFSVQDNGIGIDPQQTGRLFQVFQRLHTRSEYPGTGIGLAICKRIVEQHGGRIWVESQPGEGSIFYFTLSDQVSSLCGDDLCV